MKKFIKSNLHILFLLYMPVYMYCFTWLEKRNDVNFTNIHCFIDDYIPFCEYFVIPYLLWFAYVTAVVVYLYFKTDHLEDYLRCVITLLLGMSTCLLIYYLFPNEQNLRPEEFTNSNIFTDLISYIYSKDTKTNVLPSIHVFNALTVHIGFTTSHAVREKKTHFLRNASFTLCVLIICSTVCLKQHSMLDVISAMSLYIFYYLVVYKLFFRKYNQKQ